MNFTQAVIEYKEAFGDVPTVAGLSERKLALAAQKLSDAVRDGQPFEDDEAWYKAIGVTAPPKGSLT